MTVSARDKSPLDGGDIGHIIVYSLACVLSEQDVMQTASTSPNSGLGCSNKAP